MKAAIKNFLENFLEERRKKSLKALREQLSKTFIFNLDEFIKIITENKDKLSELNLPKCQLALLKDLANDPNETKKSLIFSDCKVLFRFESTTPTFQKQQSVPFGSSSEKPALSTQQSTPAGVPTSSSSAQKNSLDNDNIDRINDNIDCNILKMIVKKRYIDLLKLCLTSKVNPYILNDVLHMVVNPNDLIQLWDKHKYTYLNLRETEEKKWQNEAIKLLLPKLQKVTNEALVIAIKYDNHDLLESCFNRKEVNIDLNVHGQENPLIEAIRNGNYQMVQSLLQYGGKSIQISTKGEALYEASCYGNAKIVKLLLDSTKQTAAHL